LLIFNLILLGSYKKVANLINFLCFLALTFIGIEKKDEMLETTDKYQKYFLAITLGLI